MKHKILVVLSLLLVLSLGFSTAAWADEAPATEVKDAGLTDEQIEGNGWLWAKGTGYARVHGDGVIDIAAHGAVTVRVKGAEVLRAHGVGRRWDLPDGTTVFAGWRGHIHAEGGNVDVRMLGGVIEFAARGHGWAFLKGHGVYCANGHAGRWTPEGVTIGLPPAPEVE
jgi:hypothetical protein